LLAQLVVEDADQVHAVVALQKGVDFAEVVGPLGVANQVEPHREFQLFIAGHCYS
jgi:hypothetical protein